MGCPTKVKLGKDLVFSICVHDLDMVILTDADKPPVFKIYRDLEHKPIHTGDMSNLDKDSENGLYATLLHCKPEYGFFADRNYTVFIKVVVGDDVSGVTYNFIVEGPKRLEIT